MCPSAKEEYLKDILANITSDQAVHILKALWEKRSDVRREIPGELNSRYSVPSVGHEVKFADNLSDYSPTPLSPAISYHT